MFPVEIRAESISATPVLEFGKELDHLVVRICFYINLVGIKLGNR